MIPSFASIHTGGLHHALTARRTSAQGASRSALSSLHYCDQERKEHRAVHFADVNWWPVHDERANGAVGVGAILGVGRQGNQRV